MTQFCLMPKVAEKFKQDILSGEIDPAKLAEMTSVERRAFFAEHLGESNATPVNALFESKLLLKSKQTGYINWAKRVMGANKPALQDMISKINRLDKVLSPAEENAFLEDLAAQKLGVHVSYEEAQKITEFSKKVQETKGVGDRLDYGRAVISLDNYIKQLKTEADKFSIEGIKKEPLKAIGDLATGIASNTKAIQASMDNSAIFRQGWKTLWTHPSIWAKNSIESFSNIIKTFGKTEVMDELNADIVSRPNYDLMKKAKLDVGVTEEAFPTSLPEKIPVLGKIYKASENAYTAFVKKTRADVFDSYIDIAKKTGVDLMDTELKSIGEMVNSLTGRGTFGPRLEKAMDIGNSIFFSPRMIKSHIDLLTQPFTGAEGSNFVRKQASINLLKVIGGTAAVLVTLKALGFKVEMDPRSSDFGKVKVGNSRFDFSGGMGSIVQLAARMIDGKTKNSSTGEVKSLTSGKFGEDTRLDILYNFTESKLSPIASAVKEMLKGQTFSGEKPTITNEILGHVTPLPISTGIELYKTPNSANLLLGLIADGLGITVNTYEPPKKK